MLQTEKKREYKKILYSQDSDRIIVNTSTADIFKPREDVSKPDKYEEAVLGTKNYQNALRTAFNRLKQQIFFNPDMQYFVTLTYKKNQKSLEQAMYDIKIWLKHERRTTGNDIKYAWVAEYQKRGAIHIHMISNAKFEMRKNKNGHNEISYWADKHGFTSVLHINDFDKNFKPYLYLFKYMHKTQRIGKSFIHTSRNLTYYREMDSIEFDHLLTEVVFKESNSYITPEGFEIHQKKMFLTYDFIDHIIGMSG